jgi:hypothetical protein
MRERRLRFHRRTFSRVDLIIDNVLIPFIGALVIVGTVWNLGGVA